MAAFPVEPSPLGRYLGASEGASLQEIGELARLIARWERKGSTLLTYARLSIGKLVTDYVRSYPIPIDYETAIEELDLPDIMDRSVSTISGWARVADRLPETLMDYRLPMTVLSTVAAFPEPQTPMRNKVFTEGREAIVEECLRQSKSGAWVADKMRSLALKTKAIKPRQHITKQELIRQAMLVFWLYGKPDSELEQLILEDGNPLSRRELAELREHYELHLIDKQLLPEDGDSVEIPSISAPRWAIREKEEEERLKSIVHQPIDYSDLWADEVWPDQRKDEDE